VTSSPVPQDSLRTLAARTQLEYGAILRLAFPGGDLALDPRSEVAGWPEPRRVVLRAALRRRLHEAGADEQSIVSVLARVPRQADYRMGRVRIPGEAEVEKYVEAVKGLSSAPLRALAVLPLALGLRAAEVVSLRRRDVEAALDTGTLHFVRKGGKEGALPIEHVRGILRDLLDAPGPAGKPWKIAGQILSQSSLHAQYHALWALVRRIGRQARLKIRPHLLRHAFGTRMNRDGAPLLTIKEALGHASVATTQRYVHPEAADVERYMRPI